MTTDTDSSLKATAATLAVACLLSTALALAVPRWIPTLAPSSSVAVVSFDIVKFTNSQRAVASAFLRPEANDAAKTNELLLNLPARTREAIKEVAGAGTLVILKQAVVQGQTTDITDEVLVKLGLPLDVPTADAAAYSLDLAPALWGVANRAAQSTPAPSVPKSGLSLP